MELWIDFYSEEEISVQIEYEGRYPFPEKATSELFLFTCFTLRQLSNLGNHPVAMALAVLLTTYKKEVAMQLAQGTYKFPGLHEWLMLRTSAKQM